MSEERSAQTVVTSETLLDFQTQRLGLDLNQEEDAPADEVAAEEQAEKEVEAEQAEEADDKDEKEEDSSEEKDEKPHKEKVKNSYIKLREQRNAAREEATKAKAEKDALEARIRALESSKAPSNTQASPIPEKPNAANFTDAFEYAEKLADWSAKAALAERDQKDAQERIKQQQNQTIQTWQSRITEAKSEMEDFDSVVGDSKVIVPDHVRDAIIESDVGPRILYHLAAHPEDAERINKLSPVSAVREIGKLESRLEKTAEKQEKKEVKKVEISKAPTPISPIRGSRDASNSEDGENLTPAQYKALRLAGKIR